MQQLLKWVGNKQRMAGKIVPYFPKDYETYIEPFLGSGAIWGTMHPQRAIVADAFAPLMQIWQTLQTDPDLVKAWYADRYHQMMSGNRQAGYYALRAAFNRQPNGADLLFLCRSCYGGIIRFRKHDGHMSTPCGEHFPIDPESFARRVDAWIPLACQALMRVQDYRETLALAHPGDFVYCDPPYHHSQSILYGAQSFSLTELFFAIADCKRRGVRVALSLDGTKRSGKTLCPLSIPAGLFEHEVLIDCGHSMVKRFQMKGKTMEGEEVADRLLLTY